jgi:hypothetical protein
MGDSPLFDEIERARERLMKEVAMTPEQRAGLQRHKDDLEASRAKIELQGYYKQRDAEDGAARRAAAEREAQAKAEEEKHKKDILRAAAVHHLHNPQGGG